MPEEGSFIEFHDRQNQLKVPFIIYTDVKLFSILPKRISMFTKKNQSAYPFWLLHLQFVYGNVENPLKLYGGEDCVEVFSNYVKNEVKRLYHKFPQGPMKHLTNEEWRKYNRTKKCHICNG